MRFEDIESSRPLKDAELFLVEEIPVAIFDSSSCLAFDPVERVFPLSLVYKRGSMPVSEEAFGEAIDWFVDNPKYSWAIA